MLQPLALSPAHERSLPHVPLHADILAGGRYLNAHPIRSEESTHHLVSRSIHRNGRANPGKEGGARSERREMPQLSLPSVRWNCRPHLHEPDIRIRTSLDLSVNRRFRSPTRMCIESVHHEPQLHLSLEPIRMRIHAIAPLNSRPHIRIRRSCGNSARLLRRRAAREGPETILGPHSFYPGLFSGPS